MFIKIPVIILIAGNAHVRFTTPGENRQSKIFVETIIFYLSIIINKKYAHARVPSRSSLYAC